MRAIMLAAVLAGGLGQAAGAEDPGAAVRGVISDQIAAFRADDFETAFGFASPGIREMFGTPGRFGEMVRQGYPMVWRPGEVRFSDLQERGGRMLQRVLVTDEGGCAARARVRDGAGGAGVAHRRGAGAARGCGGGLSRRCRPGTRSRGLSFAAGVNGICSMDISCTTHAQSICMSVCGGRKVNGRVNRALTGRC